MALSSKLHHRSPIQQAPASFIRKRPIGAEVIKGGGVHFRVWAPNSKRVAVELAREASFGTQQVIEMNAEGDGYFEALVPTAEAGTHYRYRVDSGSFPDPASRFQPEGPHGPSRIIDPSAYRWSDQQWKGVSRVGHVIYELHIGTFTPEGTYAAAAERLEYLADLGITLIEVMPLADFPGRFGWGYDGVNLYAPTRLYGEPDDLRGFVDRAHALGIGVILDVVYNHFGPDGNYTGQFARHYVSAQHKHDWGDRLNFDDEFSAPVREYFIENAAYWIDEFHFDGLRLDATQQIHDESDEHLVAAVVRKAREAAPGRGIYVVSENDRQESHHVHPIERGGFGADALWNDDFHYTAMVAVTGRREAYFAHFTGSPHEFVSVAKWSFLFQGQRYGKAGARRGEPCFESEPDNFVTFLQNHDQIANTMVGRRIHTATSRGRLRVLTAWLLLGPSTPMLFQGQEFVASAPFQYFADHQPDLAESVAAGRRDLLKQFPSLAGKDPGKLMPLPHDEKTFRECILNWKEIDEHRWAVELHRDLIGLRKADPVISNAKRGTYDGAVLSECGFVLRYFDRTHGDRLLIANLGGAIDLAAIVEPLLAPPLGKEWRLTWSSESAKYGGSEGEDDDEGTVRRIGPETAAFYVAT